MKPTYIAAMNANFKALEKVLGDDDWFVGKQVCKALFILSDQVLSCLSKIILVSSSEQQKIHSEKWHASTTSQSISGG